ncbi:hypothetical protein AgCh_009906 [Apium graveolens]
MGSYFSSSTSSDSLNDLKFGRKIYFEDVGVGSGSSVGNNPNKSGGSGSGGGGGGDVKPASQPRKVGLVVVVKGGSSHQGVKLKGVK